MISTKRVLATPTCSATEGRIVWAPIKSLWVSVMTVCGLFGGSVFFSPGAFAAFLILTSLTVCAGHSVGMHRLLIHRSFETPLWLERGIVYLGALVGMAGPFGMIRAHDMRDWLQRQEQCHNHAAHRASFFRDAFWQMHCELKLDRPPYMKLEDSIGNDRFYRLLEATWMAQQIPIALVLFYFGGWGWVFWGVCLRISVSLTGHWLIGHFAHRSGQQDWIIDNVAVQGHNVRYAGLITFGEAWHNNHHAFPESAKLGLETGQSDLGWWFIKGLERIGLARAVKTPDVLPRRAGLQRCQTATTPQHSKRVGTCGAANPIA